MQVGASARWTMGFAGLRFRPRPYFLGPFPERLSTMRTGPGLITAASRKGRGFPLATKEGGALTDWKTDVLRMRFDEGRSWGYIIERMQGQFPGKNASQIRDIIRDVVRRDPRYKADKPAVTPPKYPRSFGWREGRFESSCVHEMLDATDISPETALKLHGLDPEKWKVVNCTDNYWQSQVRGGKVIDLYQSKLTAKPKVDGINLAEIDKHFAALDRKYSRPNIILPKRDAHLMAEVNIADLHFSKLCWHGDTPENFDHKIARETYYRIIAEIADELRGKSLEYITFVWANDFFNSDTIDKATTGGTPQDTDVRWQKMFNIGCEMLVGGLDTLAQIAPVKTFYTPSNHDEVNGYHALQYLAAWFRRDANVEINTDAFPRKYQLYGNTLLGYCHGSTENANGTKDKASRLASLMPIEAAQLWGQATYREMHAAHLHSEQMIQEINGVIVRRTSSPTAYDTWHTVSGFIGAVRKAQTFIYDRERGLKQVINTPVN